MNERGHSPDADRPAAMTASNTNSSEKTLLVLEAALTHSRFTAVLEATALGHQA